MKTLSPIKNIFIKLFCVFVVLFNLNQAFAAQSIVETLDYFDRKLIVDSKIASLTVSVFKKQNTNAKSCIKTTYNFNNRGDIISYDFERLGNSTIYEYNKNHELVRVSWKDKDAQKTEPYISEKDDLKTVKDSLKKSLGQKIDFLKKTTQKVSDPCYAISGIYEIVHDPSESFPKSAVGYLIKDHKDYGDSPKKIYIKYEYQFHK